MLILPMRLKTGWLLLKETATAWSRDSAPRLGAALSYYTIFAIPPLFVIVIFIASLLFDPSDVRTELFGQVGGLVGKQGAEAIQSALSVSNPHSKGLLASGIAIASLILTAAGLFIELQSDLNVVWGVEEKPKSGFTSFVRNRVLSFAVVVAIGFLLLVSLVVSTALSALSKYVGNFVPGLGLLWTIVNIGVSFFVITALFALIFKVLPDVRIRWREVWIGSALTALLFVIGKFLLGLYLGKNQTVSAYGAAGSVILILLWVYYSAQILFFGAEFTKAYANRCGVKFQPKEYARWIGQPEVEAAVDAKPKRKARLVQELRQEVEALRRVSATRRAE